MDIREIEDIILRAAEDGEAVRIVTKEDREIEGDVDGYVSKWDSEDGKMEISVDLGDRVIGVSAGAIKTIEIV